MSAKGASDRVKELNNRFAVAAIGSYKRDKVVVEFDDGGDVECVWDFAGFRRNLIHEPAVRVGQRRVEIADFWLKHRDAKRYRSLVFAPPGSDVTVRDNDYNTWQGLAVEPSPGEWCQNQFHIRDVICSGNEEHERWLHNWIAAMFQRPGQHGWVAPLLKGGQGIGKGYFANEQLGRMFRRRNYAHLTVPEHLTSDFNSYLEDRVYVFADEAVWGDKRAANRLKGLITEKEIMIRVPPSMQ